MTTMINTHTTTTTRPRAIVHRTRGHGGGFITRLASPSDLGRLIKPFVFPVEGPARVVLGSYGGTTSPIAAPPMTYLSVSLRDGERWTFEPPPGHDVAWVALMNGALHASSRLTSGELAIFEQANEAIEFVAEGDTRFVLGSAARHPHELVLGNYSVHTSRTALERGETEIRRIGRALRAEGKQSHALRSYG